MVSTLLALFVQQAVLKDVHILATPLEKAVDQIAKIYNSPMDISPVFKGQVVLIEATQVPESDVRNQIARTVNGTWEKKESGWHLTKTSKQRREDEQKLAAMRTRFLKKTFEVRADTEGTKAEYTKAFATQSFNQFRNEAKNQDPNAMSPPGPSAAGYGLPNQRFMTKFLLRFGLERIASIPNGHRAVFAFKPNQMQQQLGLDLSKEIDAFTAEQALWAKTMEEMSKDQESQAKTTHNNSGEARVAMAVSSDDDDSYNYSYRTMPSNLANILFTVFCNYEGIYSLKLVALPTDPKEPYFSVSATTFEGAFAGMEAPDFQMKEDPDFKLTQTSADFRTFFEGRGEPIPENRRAASIEKFADTVNNDPLSFGLSEAMIFDARKTKHNIMAILSDQSLNIFFPMFADTWFNPKFIAMMGDFVTHDEKWIRVSSAPFMEPSFPRVDLKRIIARVRANGQVNIEDRAAIAALRPRTNGVSYIERFLDRFAASATEEGAEDDALKCLGMMNESERNLALSANGVPYGQLNAKLQKHLFECAYFNEHNRLWPSKTNLPTVPSFASQEPTLLAPNGVLANAIFFIKEDKVVQIKDEDGPGSIGLMTDAKGWGNTKYQLDHPEDYPGANFTFDQSRKLSRMTVTTYTMKLKVTPQSEWSSTIQNVRPAGGTSFTIKTFPDDLKADFDAGFKQSEEYAKKRRDQLKKNGGGATH